MTMSFFNAVFRLLAFVFQLSDAVVPIEGTGSRNDDAVQGRFRRLAFVFQLSDVVVPIDGAWSGVTKKR